jgi:hypothetical protein
MLSLFRIYVQAQPLPPGDSSFAVKYLIIIIIRRHGMRGTKPTCIIKLGAKWK